MNRFYCILFLFSISILSTFAQKAVVIDSSFIENKFDNAWQVFEESTPIKTYNDLVKIEQWKNIENFPIVFSPNVKAVWFKVILNNTTNNPTSIRILTKGIDSLNAHWCDSLKHEKSYITGKNIPLSKRYINSQY